MHVWNCSNRQECECLLVMKLSALGGRSEVSGTSHSPCVYRGTSTLPAETILNWKKQMKLKFAILALAALGGAALSTGTASAMPFAPLGQVQTSNVESVAVACGPRGCVRTAPVYRRGAYVVRRPYVRRGYGYHRGYRRY